MIRGKEGNGTILSNEGYQLLYKRNELPGNQDFEGLRKETTFS